MPKSKRSRAARAAADDYDRGRVRKIAARMRAWLSRMLRRRDAIEAGHGTHLGNVPMGREGERIAEQYLRKSGYRLLERNFRAAGAEIDLIATEGKTVVFVEVKARADTRAGRPEEAVDDRKQERIRRAAEIYLDRHRVQDAPIRFDIVAITGKGSQRQVELFKDAF